MPVGFSLTIALITNRFSVTLNRLLSILVKLFFYSMKSISMLDLNQNTSNKTQRVILAQLSPSCVSKRNWTSIWKKKLAMQRELCLVFWKPGMQKMLQRYLKMWIKKLSSCIQSSLHTLTAFALTISSLCVRFFRLFRQLSLRCM